MQAKSLCVLLSSPFSLPLFTLAVRGFTLQRQSFQHFVLFPCISSHCLQTCIIFSVLYYFLKFPLFLSIPTLLTEQQLLILLSFVLFKKPNMLSYILNTQLCLSFNMNYYLYIKKKHCKESSSCLDAETQLLHVCAHIQLMT